MASHRNQQWCLFLAWMMVMMICGCHGDSEQIQHLVLMEQLPATLTSSNATPEIVIRTNYSGLVYFKEASDFKVLLNITAPSIEEAYAVHSEIIDDKGRLVVQIFEEPDPGVHITLPMIFLGVVIPTGLVAVLAFIYVLHWYCTDQPLTLKNDQMSYGNVMFGNANSLRLSGNQEEALSTVRSDDRETMFNDGSLQGVPEEPEEEELQAREMASLHATENHQGADSDQEVDQMGRRATKRRNPAAAKRLFMEQHKRQMGKRRRHPSLNDPPSYDTVMNYPVESDDSDENESSKQKLLPMQGSDSSIGDRTYQNVYREGAINTFKKLDTHIPVAHSDGDLVLGSMGRGRKANLPRLAKGTDPDGSADFEDHVDRMYRSNTSTRASRETVVAREELMKERKEAGHVRTDSNSSSHRHPVTAVIHRQVSMPNGNTSRGSWKGSKSSNHDSHSQRGSFKSTRSPTRDQGPPEAIYGKHHQRSSVKRTGSIKSNEPIYMHTPASQYIDPSSREVMRSPVHMSSMSSSRERVRSPVSQYAESPYSRSKVRSPDRHSPIDAYNQRSNLHSPPTIDSSFSPHSRSPIHHSTPLQPAQDESIYMSSNVSQRPSSQSIEQPIYMKGPYGMRLAGEKGHYAQLKPVPPPVLPQRNQGNPDIYSEGKNPMNVALTSFKSPGNSPVRNPMETSVSSQKSSLSAERFSPVNFTEEQARGGSIVHVPSTPDAAQELYDYNRFENTNPYPPGLSLPLSPLTPAVKGPGGNRFSLMSDRSLSMYGSSEIFDNQQNRENDFDQSSVSDVDGDAPPMGVSDDDILSEASLPLPSPPGYSRGPTSGINFDGSPISPAARKFLYGDSLNAISAMSPPLSAFSPAAIWNERTKEGRLIAITASPSATMDKHFVFPDIKGNGSAPYGDTDDSSDFSFPPPPPEITINDQRQVKLQPPPKNRGSKKKSQPDAPPTSRDATNEEARKQTTANGERHRQPSGNASDNYGTGERRQKLAKRERTTSGTGVDKAEKPKEGGQGSSPSRRGGGGKPLLGPKQLHMTILCTVCILSMVTTVLCQVQKKDIEVHITVYAPRSMLQAHQIGVFFNHQKRSDVESSAGYNIKAFDTLDPILRVRNSSLCVNHKCPQGCDENSGQCICHKGYRLDSKGKCVDVNECHDKTFRCHKDAGCLNHEGSYRCTCSYPFYGNGKTCDECSAPCPESMYEVQACNEKTKEPKICRACTRVCNMGYFLLHPCQLKQDVTCRLCRAACPDNMYEYTQCTRFQNRVCEKRKYEGPSSDPSKILYDPYASSNIVFESKTEVREDENIPIHYSGEIRGGRRNTFKRGSGFYINVLVKSLNPVFQFIPEDHSARNELSFPGSHEITRRYCPYPLPAYYEFKYTKHTDQKYKSYTSRNGPVIEPCTTYTRHGNFPARGTSLSDSGSILCAEPGPVSSAFEVDNEFGTFTDVWVDNKDHCGPANDECMNCTKRCALVMKTFGDCSVQESDEGSPRLQSCYTCCIKSNCSDACRDFNDRGCKTVRCQRGNLLEFILRPVYNSGEDFFCSVSPVPRQKLLELEYTIMHYNREELKHTVPIYGNQEWLKTGKLKFSDKILNIDIDSKLGKMPNFIHGTPNGNKITVGVYKDQGTKIKNAHIDANSVVARPVKPFQVTTSIFGSKTCEDDILGDLVTARASEDPYTPIEGLVAQFLDNMTYAIRNKSDPVIVISVKHQMSVLSALYPKTELDFDNFHGYVDHNGTHWVLSIRGEVKFCPGSLSLNVSDPGYMDRPLFEYEIGVRCPKNFSLVFGVPTGDVQNINKDFLITVKDQNTTYHLKIYRPSSKIAPVEREVGKHAIQGKLQQSTDEGTVIPVFPIPFFAPVSGLIFLLLLFAAFGIGVKFNQPRKDVLRFNWCHLILMVTYFTFQFLFAVCASMTVFVLIIMAVNSDTASFLRKYQLQRTVKSAYSELEMDHMESHLMAEVSRHRQVASDSKAQCWQQMLGVIQDYQKMKDAIKHEVRSNMDQENLNELLKLHNRKLMNEFKDNFAIFEHMYGKYVDHTKSSFMTDLGDTFRSVENNAWFTVPKFLYNDVKNHRTLKGDSIKPFMEWMGLRGDIVPITSDSFQLPQIPLFKDNPSTETDNIRAKQAFRLPLHHDKEKTVETHNFWIYQNELHFGPGSVERNKTVYSESETHAKKKESGSGVYVIFMIAAIFIDIVWFLHRILKAVGISRLILYGYPIYMDISKKTARSRHPSESEAQAKQRKKWCNMGVGQGTKIFLLKVVSSMFIPKVIVTLLIVLAVYTISMATSLFVNRQTFSYLGYYNSIDDMLKLHERLINERIKSNAGRINTVEYPVYQQLINLHLQRHHYMFKMAETHWQTLEGAHRELYCNYLQHLDVDAQCADPSSSLFGDIHITACHFQQIEPVLFERPSGEEVTITELQMDEFLNSIKKIVTDTCLVVLIYTAVIVVKELLGTVLWLYMKRSKFINLRILYETDEPPPNPMAQ